MAQSREVFVIQPGVQTRGISAFWYVDQQYRDTPTLTPGAAVTVADLKGPGIVTAIHMTQADINMRGMVLEIRYDGAKEPAVMCPISDFFADGCNKRSVNFHNRFTEKVPKAYNSYFAMPFKKSVQVIVRNDTDKFINVYLWLEWQTLPAWNPDFGYFHATYRRQAFEVTEKTRREFLHIQGRGQILGRQMSLVTDQGFSFVEEANQEFEIDGQPRVFDYLGTEDSFGFSWGFNFGGYTTPHSGITFLNNEAGKSYLSIYRFHDHMPVRFDKEFRWTMDWAHEDLGFGKQNRWADYATVAYWYQDEPGGFRHEPLPPMNERCLDILPKAPGK